MLPDTALNSDRTMVPLATTAYKIAISVSPSLSVFYFDLEAIMEFTISNWIIQMESWQAEKQGESK